MERLEGIPVAVAAVARHLRTHLGRRWVLDGVCLVAGIAHGTVLARARKIQRFLSQPFHVAEVFTNIPGKFVQLEETVKSFKAVVDGEYDHLPEAAFYMVGGIEEAVEKAAKLAADAA